MKRNKYNAVKTIVDGHEFASKREAKHYGELLIRERAGEIANLVLQPKFDLIVNGVKINTYTADFQYTNMVTGDQVIEDVKSAPTAKKRDFRRTCKLMKALFNIDVQVVL